jgi:hypothetical protein
MGKKYGGDTPKLGTSVPSIGTDGNPTGAGKGKSTGGQYPFMPNHYDGAMGSKVSGESDMGTSTKIPFLPDKPE